MTISVSKNPPCDLAMVRFRQREELREILVPVGGGPNSSMALELAVMQAREYSRENGFQPHITALYVVRGDDRRLVELGNRILAKAIAPFDYPIEPRVVPAPSILEGILRQTEESNLVVIGASEEGFFEQLLFGAMPERVARECSKTVMIVKRYQGPVKSWIHRLRPGA